MSWTCAMEGYWIYWANDVEAVRQEEKRKTTKEIHGCSEEGHADD